MTTLEYLSYYYYHNEMEGTQTSKYSCLNGKSTGKTVWVVNFFTEYLFLPSNNVRQTTIIYSWYVNILDMADFPPKMNKISPSTSRKMDSILLPVIRLKFSSINWNFRKHIHHRELVCFPKLTNFYNQISGGINKCDVSHYFNI